MDEEQSKRRRTALRAAETKGPTGRREAALKAAETKGPSERSREAKMAAWTRKHGKNDAANPFAKHSSSN